MITSSDRFRLLKRRSKEPTWTSAFPMGGFGHCVREDEKNRKSDAIGCILMHDLWKSFRRCTTGGGVFITSFGHSLEGCATKKREGHRVKMKNRLTIVARRWGRASVARRARAMILNHSHARRWTRPSVRKQGAARMCRAPRAGLKAQISRPACSELVEPACRALFTLRGVAGATHSSIRCIVQHPRKMPKMLRFVAFCCMALHGF